MLPFPSAPIGIAFTTQRYEAENPADPPFAHDRPIDSPYGYDLSNLFQRYFIVITLLCSHFGAVSFVARRRPAIQVPALGAAKSSAAGDNHKATRGDIESGSPIYEADAHTQGRSQVHNDAQPGSVIDVQPECQHSTAYRDGTLMTIYLSTPALMLAVAGALVTCVYVLHRAF